MTSVDVSLRFAFPTADRVRADSEGLSHHPHGGTIPSRRRDCLTKLTLRTVDRFTGGDNTGAVVGVEKATVLGSHGLHGSGHDASLDSAAPALRFMRFTGRSGLPTL